MVAVVSILSLDLRLIAPVPIRTNREHNSPLVKLHVTARA
jgi:hypothetical protein